MEPMPPLGRRDPLARLHQIATRLGIVVPDCPPVGACAASPWPDDSAAAVVHFGEHIALNPGLEDNALRADVLAMALIVAAVMGDVATGHPCAITAPRGLVLIFRTRVPGPVAGPGLLATQLARKCGRDTASAAFEYAVPAAHVYPGLRRRPAPDQFSSLPHRPGTGRVPS
jgi:hypothetical protein